MMILSYIFLNIIVFVSTLGILILVHESGHFVVARCFKVKVERFSIGFGPVLWKKIDSRGTEYIISAILLGGYVKLTDSVLEKAGNYYNLNRLCYYKHICRRFCIIIAGPIFNFIFAILLYTVIFIIGISSYKPVINYILPNSIVAQSDIPIGSKIKSINDIPVNNWKSVSMEILNNFNKEKIFVLTEFVDSDFGLVSKMNTVILPKWFSKVDCNIVDPIAILGMLPNVMRVMSIISNEELHFFNQQVNLQISDKILLINGQSIYDKESFVKLIQNNFNKTFNMIIERDGNIFNLDCKFIKNNLFDYKKIRKNIDLFFETIVVDSMLYSDINKYDFCTAVLKSIGKVWDCICFVMHTLFKLIDGDVNIANLHGPVEIAKIATQTVQHGVIDYIILLSLISINLGVINLIPIPILDGGRLLLLLIEVVCNRPISLGLQNFIYVISYIILIIIFCITLYNDIVK